MNGEYVLSSVYSRLQWRSKSVRVGAVGSTAAVAWCLGGIFFLRTSLLFLDGQFLPATLHAVTEGHPEIGLLLKGHTLPSLLNVVESRLRECLGGSGTGGDGRSNLAHDTLAEDVGGGQHF